MRDVVKSEKIVKNEAGKFVTKNRYRYIDEGRSHLHTLDGKPLIGTSTIAKESVNKGDGLMQWYADLAAISALGMQMAPERYAELLVQYEEAQSIQDWRVKNKAVKKLDTAFPLYAEARKAAIRKRDGSAAKGTLRHGVLEDYIRHCLEKNDGKPMKAEHAGIQVFIDWALENVEVFYFTEAYCYSERLWIGGISDIGMKIKYDGGVLDMGGQVKREGQRLTGDHKSSKNAFFDQFIQNALYDIQLAENGIMDRDGNKLGEWELSKGYVVFPFRSDPFTPEFRWNVDEYRAVAEGVVRTYKLKEYGHV